MRIRLLLVKYIFHEKFDLFCLVLFMLVLNKTTAVASRWDPFQTMFAAQLA
jgi:hypothetical protein